MKAALNVRFLNCHGLYELLVNHVGVCRALAFSPLVTVQPEVAHLARGLAKDLAGAGFDIIPSVTYDGADDGAIKNRMRLLEPDEIAEIVILSSDKDYLPILLHKAQQGISVYWVATNRPQPGQNKSALSPDVSALFRSGVFHFFELAKFTGMIGEKKPIPYAQNGNGTKKAAECDFTRVTLKLRNRDNSVHLQLASELRRIEALFKGKGLQVIIEE